MAQSAVGNVNSFLFIGGVVTGGAGVERTHHGEVHSTDVDTFPDWILPGLEQYVLHTPAHHGDFTSLVPIQLVDKTALGNVQRVQVSHAWVGAAHGKGAALIAAHNILSTAPAAQAIESADKGHFGDAFSDAVYILGSQGDPAPLGQTAMGNLRTPTRPEKEHIGHIAKVGVGTILQASAYAE